MEKEVFLIAEAYATIPCLIEDETTEAPLNVEPNIFTQEDLFKEYVRLQIKIELIEFTTAKELEEILDQFESKELFSHCRYAKDCKGTRGECYVNFYSNQNVLEINIRLKKYRESEFSEYSIAVRRGII